MPQLKQFTLSYNRSNYKVVFNLQTREMHITELLLDGRLDTIVIAESRHSTVAISVAAPPQKWNLLADSRESCRAATDPFPCLPSGPSPLSHLVTSGGGSPTASASHSELPGAAGFHGAPCSPSEGSLQPASPPPPTPCSFAPAPSLATTTPSRYGRKPSPQQV